MGSVAYNVPAVPDVCILLVLAHVGNSLLSAVITVTIQEISLFALFYIVLLFPLADIGTQNTDV